MNHDSSTTPADRRIRVLMVTGAYFPEISAGGLQSRAVAREIAGRADVQVLTTSTDPSLAAHETIDGARVSRIYIDVTSRASRARAIVRMAFELLRIMPVVDLIHVQGYSSKNILLALVAKMLRRPIVLHLQTATHDEPPVVAAQGRLAWWAFATADQYLSVSPGLTQHFLAAGLPADRIQQAPNGVDAERFRPASSGERVALRTALGLPVARPLILFVGVMSQDKQPHVLFDAWLGLQREPALASTLVLVGSTSRRQFEADAGLAADIRRRADQAGVGDRVIFVPPTNQIHDYFRAADVYVMPSIREGLPIALLEAMACGLPCVASHLPGATDVMIEDGVNGRLVPPRETAAFASALGAAIANPDGAARMGAAARRTVEERYTMPRVADIWLATYLRVLGR
jgi:glycosyltransferase involved in cell wall biosynthesis